MGFNFNGVDPEKGGGGNFLDPGTYVCRIRDPKPYEAQTGTKGLEVTFEDEASGGEVRDRQFITAKTLPYFRYRLEAAGVPLPKGEWEPDASDPKFMKMVKALDGARVKITVYAEPDRDDPDKTWARVRDWEKPDGAPGSADDDGIPF